MATRSSHVSFCVVHLIGKKNPIRVDADTLWRRRNRSSTSLVKGRKPLVSTLPARNKTAQRYGARRTCGTLYSRNLVACLSHARRARAMRPFTSPASFWLSPVTFEESSNRMAQPSSGVSLMGITPKAVFPVSTLAKVAVVRRSTHRSSLFCHAPIKRQEKIWRCSHR